MVRGKAWIHVLVVFLVAALATGTTLAADKLEPNQVQLAKDILAQVDEMSATPIQFEEVVVRASADRSTTTRYKVWHGSEGRYRIERTEDTGRQITIVCNGETRWTLDSNIPAVLVEHDPFPARRRYSAVPFLAGRLSGEVLVQTTRYFHRPVYLITITGDKSTHKLWIDREKFLVWKEEKSWRNSEGLYLSYKTNAEWSPIFAQEDFSLAHGGRRMVDKREWIRLRLTEQSGFAVGLPTVLPAGYEFFRSRVLTVDANKALMLQYRERDQLLSVFQHKDGFSRQQLHQLKQKIRGAQAEVDIEVAFRSRDGMTYVAVGPVSKNELEMLLDSIK